MARRDQQLRRLIQDLENPATRQRAVESLAALGESAVGPLGQVVRDGDLNTSQAASRALALMGEPAVETLCELLNDSDWNVSRSAATALARIGAPAVEPLCRKLADPDPNAASIAAGALAKIRKPASDALCRSLCNPDPGVRAHAAHALAKSGSAAIPTLTRAFREPDLYVSVDRPGTPSPEMDAPREAVRIGAAAALARIGGTALDVLCSALDSPNEEQRRIAAWALEQGGDSAIEALIRCVQAEKPRRWSILHDCDPAPALAALTLGRMGMLRALSPLLFALDHRDARVRRAAAQGLGELASRDRSPELRAHLPHLRRRMRKARWSEDQEPLAFAIQSIEAVTDAVAAVPLPSHGLSPVKDTLPRPAGPARSNVESLPVAATAGDTVSPPAVLSLWTRFVRRLWRFR